jgi:hypothetical protein
MGDGQIFPKNLGDSLFNDDLSNEPNLAGSISQDSTFNNPKKEKLMTT